MRRLLIVCFTVILVAIPLLSQSAAAQDEDALTLWIDPNVPATFADMLTPLLQSDEYQWVNQEDDAQIVVSISDEPAAINSTWVYVPVLTFDNLTETLPFGHLQTYWTDNPDILIYLTGDVAPTLMLTAEVYDALTVILGPPSDATPVEVVPADALVNLLWEQRPNAWSIMPFDELVPQVKVLPPDQIDVFSPEFDVSAYPLRMQVGIDGEDEAVGRLAEDLLETKLWRATNRDESKLTRIVISGVTAMARATAYKMETLGLTHPAEGVMDFIGDADIMHTSNEVPFSENCPEADPFLSTTIFCSDDRYMALLTHIGLDVVELTGNHINDYGPGAFRHSLELYEEAGIATFGGGYAPEDARAAYLTEHNGNSIAFIGCNVPGPFKAWVSTERAGAAPCDEEFLAEELPRLAQEVDILIMTVQQWEFYRYSVGREQVTQFTNFVNLGADIVIGSQAHQPQGFTFVNRDGQRPSYLHHGLGNLFFDQMNEITTRQMFLDKLIIYDGELINVVLYTGLLEDFCCPRPMTSEERREFLGIIFLATEGSSGWFIEPAAE